MMKELTGGSYEVVEAPAPVRVAPGRSAALERPAARTPLAELIRSLGTPAMEEMSLYD
jgi:hypothetical protein